MENCVFCKIIKNKIKSHKIYEDDKFIAILDTFPSKIGHTLIIPKNHFKDLFDIDNQSLSEILLIAKKLSLKLKKVLKFDSINLLQNNGLNAGQTIFHYHLHLIPRYENDNININWKVNSSSAEDYENLLSHLNNLIDEGDFL